MRYAIQSTSDHQYNVVDRRCPLRPVLQTQHLSQAIGFALSMSVRSVWGW
jgi:hypothetical protein